MCYSLHQPLIQGKNIFKMIIKRQSQTCSMPAYWLKYQMPETAGGDPAEDVKEMLKQADQNPSCLPGENGA